MGGLLVTPVILLPASWFFGLESDFTTLLNNAFYLVVLSLFLMIILEASIYFDESAESRLATQKLQQISSELKESREQLQSILSNLAGAAYRCHFDEDYTMQYISEKIFDISGYHSSDYIDNKIRTYASIIHPEDMDLCRKNILQATLSKVHYEFEYRIIHRNGSIVWVSENGKGICNDEGYITLLDGIIIDITRRKEAEFAAAESERNFKELMELFPQPIFELDIEGNILFTNGSGKEFFGIVMPENPNEKISALDFMVKEDVPRVQENIKKSNQAILSTPIEYTVKRPDGTRCPVLIYGSPIIRNEKVVGRRGIIIDISERKKQELRLLEAKEELERINNTLEQHVEERTKQLTEANTQLLKVQKENLQSQFEVLKQQVNPHFLFNSLNVLTSLIKIDPDLAESFTERLSKVYRYVLENKEKDVVSLSTELEFLYAYLFLLEIRFMNKIIIEINIDKSYYDFQILPIAIQLLIENAIKHNTFSKIKPLKIEIFIDRQQRLNIINNLNIRETKLASTGVGLENISRRYALVSDQKPEFNSTSNQFIAKLPLLKSEKFETE
jgi:PAS domain S-box-containing protein